jgi:hypothetical protein
MSRGNQKATACAHLDCRPMAEERVDKALSSAMR